MRERIQAGDSDQAVKDFLVARYGEFVLLKPPVRGWGWLLWLTPPVLLLAGIVASLAALRRRRAEGTGAEARLTAEEEAALKALAERGEKAASP